MLSLVPLRGRNELLHTSIPDLHVVVDPTPSRPPPDPPLSTHLHPAIQHTNY